MKMKHHLTRNGNENSTQKLLEYEATQDARVVQNTPFRCRRTYIGLGTESIDEYNTLKEHNEHIVFTNRNEILISVGMQYLYNCSQDEDASWIYIHVVVFLHVFL